MTGGDAVPGIEPFGLLDGLPEEVLASARDWERHVVEVEACRAGRGAGHGAASGVRPTGMDRGTPPQAKADELGVTSRTVERMRARYADQGLWGLVDRRAARTREATGALTRGWSRWHVRSSRPRPMPRQAPGDG